MAYTKKTLRKLAKHPDTRKVAEAINELDRSVKKLKRLLPVIQQMEFHSQALRNQREHPTASEELEIKPAKQTKEVKVKTGITPNEPDWEELGG